MTMELDENEHLGLILIATTLEQVLLVCFCFCFFLNVGLQLEGFGKAPNPGWFSHACQFGKEIWAGMRGGEN